MIIPSKIYTTNHLKFFDRLVQNKRIEISTLINKEIENCTLKDALDIGTTEDKLNKSSNIIIKNLKNINIFKSISDQDIKSDFFTKKLKKSITLDFNKEEINEFSSDIVVSNATIEHVGNEENQLMMIKNIIKLSKKIFIIITPNRWYPIDFHTKIPFIHWLPKKIHRNFLNLIGLSFFSEEKNLNLLNEKDFNNFMKNFNFKYKILNVKLFYIKSNLILIGKK